MLRTLSKTFLHGLVTITPLAFTLYVLWWLGSGAEMGFGKLLQLGLPERFYVPGMGLCLGLLLVFVAGVVMRAWFVRRFLALAELLVQRIPLVGTLYGSIKDLMAFVGGREKRNVKAVTVSIGDPTVRLLGLLTRESAADLTANEQDRNCAAVYLPMSYALGGFMVLAPRASVTPLAMSAEDALRTALTAGMSAEAQTTESVGIASSEGRHAAAGGPEVTGRRPPHRHGVAPRPRHDPGDNSPDRQ
jgi:uncharacterized membrane protein